MENSNLASDDLDLEPCLCDDQRLALHVFDVMGHAYLDEAAAAASHLPPQMRRKREMGNFVSDVMGGGHSNDDGVGIHLARGLKGVDDNAAVVYGPMEGNRLALCGLGRCRVLRIWGPLTVCTNRLQCTRDWKWINFNTSKLNPINVCARRTDIIAISFEESLKGTRTKTKTCPCVGLGRGSLWFYS